MKTNTENAPSGDKSLSEAPMHTPRQGHTPGPWEVAGELSHLRVNRYNSENPNACDGIRQIALVTQGDYEIPHYGEAEANARLIAAAPELLAALDELLASYVSLVNSGDAGSWNPETDAEVKAARAAIAKAKGGAL